MFKNLSFKAKLLGLCIGLLSVSLIVGGVGYVFQAKVASKYELVVEKTFPKIVLVNKMFLEYRRVRISVRTLGLTGLTPAEADKAIQDTESAIAGYEGLSKEYVALGFSPGQKEIYDQVEKRWSEFKAVGIRAIGYYKSGKPEDREKMYSIFWKDCPEMAAAYTATVEQLTKFHNDTVKELAAEAIASAATATNISVFTILTGLLLGLGGGFLFATSLAKTIGQIVESLNENARQVSAASVQIAASSGELSQATAEQAASLQETAASIEEMSAMVKKNSDNAVSTAGTSNDSQKKAVQGKAVVEQMLGSMVEIDTSNGEIMGQINRSNQQMAEIVKVIQEIGNKTKVINDIVFQTKLLSFNASVEAARAGEHGKGFAVVAEEVGNLAAMSGNAAKEITTMLESSIQKVEGIVTETKVKVEALVQSGKGKVEAGTRVARDCAGVLDEIVKDVSSVSEMAGQISSASQEQSQGVHELTKAMSQLDQATQQNAATSEETASAAEQLSAQAESLKAAVELLAGMIEGAGRSVSAATATVAVRRVSKPAGNVLPLKKAGNAKHLSQPHKSAVGDGTVPDRSHPGFEEV